MAVRTETFEATVESRSHPELEALREPHESRALARGEAPRVVGRAPRRELREHPAPPFVSS